MEIPAIPCLLLFNTLGTAKVIINYRSTYLLIRKSLVLLSYLILMCDEYTQYRPNWSIFSL